MYVCMQCNVIVWILTVNMSELLTVSSGLEIVD